MGKAILMQIYIQAVIQMSGDTEIMEFYIIVLVAQVVGETHIQMETS